MNVTGGATDVTTYFVLRLAATGVEATGLTITNFDLQYTRSGVAPTAKVDATALAATDSAHGDNQAIEIDATDQPGLYRVDWPDAAFAAGVKEVILTVKCATCFTEHLRVQIDTPVNATKLNGTALTGRDIGASVLLSSGTGTGQLDFTSGVAKSNLTQIGGDTQSATDLKDFADAGYDPATNKVEGVKLADTVTTYTGNTPQTGDVFPLASTEIADIKAKTDNLPSDPADASVVAGLIAAVQTVVDAVQAKTDNLPSDPADQSAVEAAITAAVAPLALEATAQSILTDTAEIGAAGAGLTVLATAANLATIAGYLDTEIAAIKAKTDNLPASPAAVGSAMTLTSGERDSVAAATLDLANGVETGVTLRQAQRIQLSSAAGKLSGAATTTVTVRDANDSKNRIVATVDADGNRTAVTLDAS